jgi:hypothetical protein
VVYLLVYGFWTRLRFPVILSYRRATEVPVSFKMATNGQNPGLKELTHHTVNSGWKLLQIVRSKGNSVRESLWTFLLLLRLVL